MFTSEGFDPTRGCFTTVAARAVVLQRRLHRELGLSLGAATDHLVADVQSLCVRDDEAAGLTTVLHDDEAGVDLPRHDVAVGVHHVDPAAVGAEGVEHAVRPPPKHREDRVADGVQEGPAPADEGRGHLGVALEHLAELAFREIATEDAGERDGDAEKGEEKEGNVVHVCHRGNALIEHSIIAHFPVKSNNTAKVSRITYLPLTPSFERRGKCHSYPKSPKYQETSEFPKNKAMNVPITIKVPNGT